MKAVFWAIFIAMFASVVIAEPVCKATSWHNGTPVLEGPTGPLLYRLDVVGEDWDVAGYGYHAAAAISCKNCPNEEASWGLFYISDVPQPREVPQKQHYCLRVPFVLCPDALQNQPGFLPAILTAADYMEVRPPGFLYQLTIEEALGGEVFFSSDTLTNGAFQGYGVVWGNTRGTAHEDGVNYVYLSIGLHDGCASVTGTLAVPRDGAEERLLSLVDSLVITSASEW